MSNESASTRDPREATPPVEDQPPLTYDDPTLAVGSAITQVEVLRIQGEVASASYPMIEQSPLRDLSPLGR